MSKTITIPTCKNPYVVIVNNKEYTYKAGETVEVPDEVAEVIESHIEAQHTTKAPASGSSSVGVTKEWQKLLDVELTEATDAVETNVDTNGNPFSVEELLFRAYIPSTADGGAAYFKIGQGKKDMRYYFSQKEKTYLGASLVVVDGILHHISGYTGTSESSYKIAHPYINYLEGVNVGAKEITSLSVGLSNAQLVLPIGTKIKVYGR